MADRPASEKTHPPTAERLRKARREGMIPQSQELPSALILGGLLLAAALAAADLWRWFVLQVHDGLAGRLVDGLSADAFLYLFRTKLTEALWAMAPFMLTAGVGSVLSGVLVGGWQLSPKAIGWKLNRLSPNAGFKQLLSARSAVHVLVALVKLVILVAIIAAYLRDRLGEVLALASATPVGTLAVSVQLVWGLLSRVTIALLAIAAADVLYQKWQYKRQLRMTREEVKEERRSHEASPLVKRRLLTLYFTLVQKRMLRQVPQADVVVTNPTHVAVALKYDAATMDAPTVLAKGADLLCEKIKALAREHGVPIVERPELARTLYASVEVGQTVPEALYVAVAEILATIYRLRGRRQAAGAP